MQRLSILYEDNHLLIVNKPGGLLVQGDQTGDDTLLDLGKSYVKEKYNKPGEVFLGLPHRLDRVTSGAVILCRTSKSLSRVSQLFKDRHIDKIYAAIIKYKPGLPRKGMLEGYIVKDKKINKSKIITAKLANRYPDARKAKLEYKLLEQKNGLAFLQIFLHTGRPHQIRAQISHAGFPILGDMKYHSTEKFGKYIALHAWKLRFIHPVKQILVEIEADFPARYPWNEFA